LFKPGLALERVLITLWVGSIWVVGYVVAPTLFSMPESRQLAGDIAGRLFGYVNQIGLVCGGILLVLMWFHLLSGWLRSWRLWVLVAMLGITAIGEYFILPKMTVLKLAAGGEFLPGSPLHQQFATLHGVSSALFVVNSVFGLLLVVWPWSSARIGR